MRVGRYQSSFFPGVLEQGGLFSRKRTSLFLVEPDALTHVSDLPSAGDTAYAGIVIQGDEAYISYYTSSPKKDPTWVVGMFGPTASGWPASRCPRWSAAALEPPLA